MLLYQGLPWYRVRDKSEMQNRASDDISKASAVLSLGDTAELAVLLQK